MNKINYTPIYNINNILNEYLKPFECAAKVGKSFAYYPTRSLISYTMTSTEEYIEKVFYDFAIEHNLKYDVGVFILSLFHELGHNETLYDISEKEYIYSLKAKKILNKNHIEGDKENTKKELLTYFNLPVELTATLWAIDHINNNLEEIKELAKSLDMEFIKFYKVNNYLTK